MRNKIIVTIWPIANYCTPDCTVAAFTEEAQEKEVARLRSRAIAQGIAPSAAQAGIYACEPETQHYAYPEY